MEDGPPRFNRDFTCPGLLGYPDKPVLAFRIRDSHPLRCAVPGAFRYAFQARPQGPTTPAGFNPNRFRLFPVRSPLLRESHVDFISCRYLDVAGPCVGLPLEG